MDSHVEYGIVPYKTAFDSPITFHGSTIIYYNPTAHTLPCLMAMIMRRMQVQIELICREVVLWVFRPLVDLVKVSAGMWST